MTRIPLEKIIISAGRVSVRKGFRVTVKLSPPSPHGEHFPFVVYYGEIGGQLAMEGAGNITSARRLLQSKVGIGKIAILKDIKGTEIERIEQPRGKYMVYNRGTLWNELDNLKEAVELAKGLEEAGNITTVIERPSKLKPSGELIYETEMSSKIIPEKATEIIPVSRLAMEGEEEQEEK